MGRIHYFLDFTRLIKLGHVFSKMEDVLVMGLWNILKNYHMTQTSSKISSNMHVWWKCMHLDEKFFNKWCFWFKVWTYHKGQSYYHMTCLFQTSAKYKTFDTQRVLYFGRNSQRAFSLYFMRSKFCKLSHTTNSLILQPTGLSPSAPAASVKLDAASLNHSRIHRKLLLFCQFWSLSEDRGGGIILIMHYYHCKTPW
jgi:hypothetical protein